MKLSNRAYDALNDVVKLGLPALGTMYFAIALIWGLPGGEQVVGTLAAFATAGGVWLKFLNKNYEAPTDGTIDVDTMNPEHATVRLALDDDAQIYEDGATVTLRVSSNAGRHAADENYLPNV